MAYRYIDRPTNHNIKHRFYYQLESQCLAIFMLALLVLITPSALLADESVFNDFGLYKDGEKIAGFEELFDPAINNYPRDDKANNTQGKEFRSQVVGESKLNLYQEQNEYIRLILQCRDIADRLSSGDRITVPLTDVARLLSIKDKLVVANTALMAKFEKIGDEIRKI